MRRWLLLLVVALLIGWGAGQVVPALLPQAEAGIAHGLPAPADDGSPWSAEPGIEPRPVMPAAPAASSRAAVPQPTDAGAASGAAGEAAADPAGRSRVESLRDLRRRLTEAAQLGRAAQAGDAAAHAERARRQASEPDPRIRAALAAGEVPEVGRWRPSAPSLPVAAAPAPAGAVKAYWITPDEERGGTYESAIEVDEQGRATVETVYEPTEGVRWRVRYSAWAYRDDAGNTVIDARGQAVDLLERPPWGAWSPDSMVVRPDGLVDLIDDKHDAGQGTTGARAPG